MFENRIVFFGRSALFIVYNTYWFRGIRYSVLYYYHDRLR